MVALAIDGCTIPVRLETWETSPREVGATEYSYSGRPLKTERARYKTWRFATPPKSLSDAEAYAVWCAGLGDRYRWAGTWTTGELAQGQWSDKGIGPNTASAEVYAYRPSLSYSGVSISDGNLVAEGPAYATSVLACEAARTNLLSTTVRRASDYTAFTAISGATLSNETTIYMQGVTSVKAVTGGSPGGGIETPETACSAMTTYAATVYVLPATNLNITIDLRAGTTGLLSSKGTTTVACPANVWTRLRVIAATTIGNNRLAVRVTTPTTTATFYTDQWQVEAGPYETTWADGARNVGKLTYPVSGLRRSCSVSFWAKAANPGNPAAASYLLAIGDASGNHFIRIYRNASATNFIVSIRGASATLDTTCTLAWGATSTWHHIAVTLDAEARTAYAYVDGALSQTIALTAAQTPDPSLMTIMAPANLNGANNWEGTISEMGLYPACLTSAMVAAIYAGISSRTIAPPVLPRVYASGNLVGLQAPGVPCVGQWVGQNSTPGVISGSTWSAGGSTALIQLDTDGVY